MSDISKSMNDMSNAGYEMINSFKIKLITDSGITANVQVRCVDLYFVFNIGEYVLTADVHNCSKIFRLRYQL